MRQCDKHLVYLGLGVFLQLKEWPTVSILGTVRGQDPETHKLLVASVNQPIKHEQPDEESTNVYSKKQASAAAGSAAQLDRVEKELLTTLIITGTTNAPDTRIYDRQQSEPNTVSHTGLGNYAGKRSMVNMLPFEIQLVRLSLQEISKHTCREPPSDIPQSESERSSPVRTRSMTCKSSTTHRRKCTVSGRPTQLLTPKIPTFNIRRHILCRQKQKACLKCRIKGVYFSLCYF